MPSSHLILCRPLLLLPLILPSIRVFSNESALCVRWPKYWSFSFTIIPSKEHLGLISFRMGWLDLLAVCKFNCCGYCLVAQLCLTLCDSMDCNTPGFPVHHQPLEFAQTLVHQVSDAIQPSHPCHLLLLPPSTFPSIRVCSNESVLHISWPKYWSFSFSII